jgi:hypothetical protein
MVKEAQCALDKLHETMNSTNWRKTSRELNVPKMS